MLTRGLFVHYQTMQRNLERWSEHSQVNAAVCTHWRVSRCESVWAAQRERPHKLQPRPRESTRNQTTEVWYSFKLLHFQSREGGWAHLLTDQVRTMTQMSADKASCPNCCCYSKSANAWLAESTCLLAMRNRDTNWLGGVSVLIGRICQAQQTTVSCWKQNATFFFYICFLVNGNIYETAKKDIFPRFTTRGDQLAQHSTVTSAKL